MLAATNPEVAFRDCETCQAFVFDEDGALVYYRKNGRLEPLPRGTTPTPCRTVAGCPKGTPENSLGLSPRNLQAVRFHRRCEAVGRWPEDAMTEANASIIQAADTEAERILRERRGRRRAADSE